MTLHSGLGLPSDSIGFRTGFDGQEPRELITRIQPHLDPSRLRLTVAINTWYPECQSAHYFNRGVLELVQCCLEQVRLWVVASEYYRVEGLIPVEGPGTLERDEDYFLVNAAQEVSGFLYMWSLDCNGGGGDYYGDDNMVVDIIIGRDAAQDFKDDLVARCRKHGVQFTEFPEVLSGPVRGSNTLQRLLRMFSGGRPKSGHFWFFE